MYINERFLLIIIIVIYFSFSVCIHTNSTPFILNRRSPEKSLKELKASVHVFSMNSVKTLHFSL